MAFFVSKAKISLASRSYDKTIGNLFIDLENLADNSVIPQGMR
ncbi:protein of unknown function [Vibrio tapetis subsp. tapetis]|uniref:Uncharacterized protein n=1 Tax=Vibrio tapetis subsp. tapetis TaxID=1671868 RepID=A0A2N8ZJ57_9VIBR|nr:protein of unknown function [Vibrio tapetis subsp. tapetis]